MALRLKTPFRAELDALCARHGVDNYKELSKMTGIYYQTLRDRLVNPRMIRFSEIISICEALCATEDEVTELTKTILN